MAIMFETWVIWLISSIIFISLVVDILNIVQRYKIEKLKSEVNIRKEISAILGEAIKKAKQEKF
jgi:hypothetical protein